MKLFFYCIFCLLFFASCSLPKFEAGEATNYYTLGDLHFKKPTQVKNTLTLLVNETQTSPILASTKIVFKPSDHALGYYRYASWAEPPAKRLTNLMLAKIEAEGIYNKVSLLSGTTVSDLVLNTTLLSFEQDLTSDPVQVNIVLRAELVDAVSRKVIALETFTQRQEVGRSNVESAVNAFNIATAELMQKLITWLNAISDNPLD